jgi:hypothetical protein
MVPMSGPDGTHTHEGSDGTHEGFRRGQLAHLLGAQSTQPCRGVGSVAHRLPSLRRRFSDMVAILAGRRSAG